MKYRYHLILVLSMILIVFVSCEKEPDFRSGSYRYGNGELTYIDSIETVGDFTVLWANDATNEQQAVVREILENMVLIPAGYFYMGAQKTDSIGHNYDLLALNDESPVHEVHISHPFYINKYEITQKEWFAIMGEQDEVSKMWTELYGLGDKMPAYYVSYSDLSQFIEKLNHISSMNFRMPTEAEWEYAARGARKSRHTIYSGSSNPNDVAWHNGNSGDKMHPVGGLHCNEMQLFDMSGNVWEWCSDQYGNYTAAYQEDPIGATNAGNKYVLRGGSWSYHFSSCRVSKRDYYLQSSRSFCNGGRLVLIYE